MRTQKGKDDFRVYDMVDDRVKQISDDNLQANDLLLSRSVK